MIRDPSDGSVKEAPQPIQRALTTGLRSEEPGDLAELDRLKRSREWLAEYRKMKSA